MSKMVKMSKKIRHFCYFRHRFFTILVIFAILAINFLAIFAIMAKMVIKLSPFLLFFSQKSMEKMAMSLLQSSNNLTKIFAD